MKALFHIQQNDTPALKDFFAGTHPWMVKIANKPSLEYLLDFAILCQCTEIRLVMDEPDLALRNYFAEGRRWGINITYSSCSVDDDLDKILEKNSHFCDSTPLLVTSGLFFVHYHKDFDYKNWHIQSNSGMMLHCSTGTLLYGKTVKDLRYLSNITNGTGFALSPVSSVKDVYDLTMQVLENEQENYVLPGYGPEKDILIGRNVEISPLAKLHPPVIIADNANIIGKSEIGPNAAIGKGAIIDKGSFINNAVVADHTYLGKGLSLEKKMVNGSHLFSAPDNQWVNQSDDLFFKIAKPRRIAVLFRSVIDKIAALLIILFLLPGWGLFAVTTRLTTKNTHSITYFNDKEGKLFSYTPYSPPPGSVMDNFFQAFSLGKVQLLLKVLTGTLSLVGNRPILATKQNLQLLQSFDHYHPGAFGYSETEGFTQGSLEEETSERFFAANSRLTSDFKTLFTTLKHNLTTCFSHN